jgi:GNAT superfamily N-acetyltransferase
VKLEYSLRPATEADFDFLFHLHGAALGPYVTLLWGWDEADQRRRFRRAFNPSRIHIVHRGEEEEDIGAIAVERRERELYLARLELLPSHQGKGIGTALLQWVIAQAEQENVAVTLQVLKVNPARRLYERLGFATIGETETHYLMLRPAAGVYYPQ